MSDEHMTEERLTDSQYVGMTPAEALVARRRDLEERERVLEIRERVRDLEERERVLEIRESNLMRHPPSPDVMTTGESHAPLETTTGPDVDQEMRDREALTRADRAAHTPTGIPMPQVGDAAVRSTEEALPYTPFLSPPPDLVAMAEQMRRADLETGVPRTSTTEAAATMEAAVPPRPTGEIVVSIGIGLEHEVVRKVFAVVETTTFDDVADFMTEAELLINTKRREIYNAAS